MAGFAIRAIGASALASTAALIAYEITVVLAAALLVLAAGSMGRAGEVADLVVELDDAGGIGLEGALRRELGDPRLTISYADAMDPGGGADDDAADQGRERLLIDLDGGAIRRALRGRGHSR